MTKLSKHLRSKELVSLSWPLALLMAMLFTLNVHLGASFAAGSDSSLCLWAKKIATTDRDGNPQPMPNQHCSLCTLSDELDDVANLVSIDNKSILNNLLTRQELQVQTKFALAFTPPIRAPPAS